MIRDTVSCDTNLKKRQILNRYLDLSKFVDFLRTSELHLEPASNFDDHLEGTLPESIRKSINDSQEIKKILGDISILDHERKNKDRTNLSCWTLGPKDNMALWKIYGGSKQSVIITTTVERMISSAFNWLNFGEIKFKKVRYIDHAGRAPNGVYSIDENIFGLKHKAYFFEKEVRVVLTRQSDEPLRSIRLPVDINKLITKITVAPEAGDWFYNLIVDLAKKYNISVPVTRSDLTFLINKAQRKANQKIQPTQKAAAGR